MNWTDVVLVVAGGSLIAVALFALGLKIKKERE